MSDSGWLWVPFLGFRSVSGTKNVGYSSGFGGFWILEYIIIDGVGFGSDLGTENIVFFSLDFGFSATRTLHYTGIASGSVYNSSQFRQSCFPAEGIYNGSVIVIKTHVGR